MTTRTAGQAPEFVARYNDAVRFARFVEAVMFMGVIARAFTRATRAMAPPPELFRSGGIVEGPPSRAEMRARALSPLAMVEGRLPPLNKKPMRSRFDRTWPW